MPGIDSLDGKIGGRQQLLLYGKVQELLRKQTVWFLRHGLSEESSDPRSSAIAMASSVWP